MPYDPRPESKGGNRGIDERFQRAPEEGNFRAIQLDDFDGSDWVLGDYETLAEADEAAVKAATSMQFVFIYDKGGTLVEEVRPKRKGERDDA